MKLKETNYYRVIQENPWISLGTDIDKETMLIEFDKFPKIFSKVYVFENGHLVINGDNVYRVVNGSIKTVKLNDIHISNDVTVFPTKESAEEEIIKLEERKQASFRRAAIYDNMESIQIISDIKNFDDISLKTIKEKLKLINKLATIDFEN